MTSGNFKSNLPSCVVEQGHESFVHMILLVAMKERQARVVGDEIKFQFLEAPELHSIELPFMNRV